MEREPTVQVEELGAVAPLEKGCPRVAKLDTNDRADVAVPTPVWRQRFTVLDDAQAERARRQGVRRPRSEWREIRVGPHYGDLNHVRDRLLSRNRSWEETPLLEVIWGGYENPVPWLPYGLTERNTQFELDRLGEVHGMVRIGYEDAPNLHGYLFRASFGDEEPKWYFIESMMTLEDRFLSAEAVGRDFEPASIQQRHQVSPVGIQQRHQVSPVGIQQRHQVSSVGIQRRHQVSPVSIQQRHQVSPVCIQQRHQVSPLCTQQRHQVSPVCIQQRHQVVRLLP